MQKETHRLTPYINKNTKVLILGSFPPQHHKWSMEFYYPNFQNDMWRILASIFFDDPQYFLDLPHKTFKLDKIQKFLLDNHFGLADTAKTVIRLEDNASDKFLQILEVVDLSAILEKAPLCHSLIVTGEKAGLLVQKYFDLPYLPKVGHSIIFETKWGEKTLFRAPSSSRAYPLAFEKKVYAYRQIFSQILC